MYCQKRLSFFSLSETGRDRFPRSSARRPLLGALDSLTEDAELAPFSQRNKSRDLYLILFSLSNYAAIAKVAWDARFVRAVKVDRCVIDYRNKI